jgi:hypothetical protein
LTPVAASVTNVEASGNFVVADFTPVPLADSPVVTAAPVGLATMTKTFEGEVSGTAATLFTAAYDQETGVGTYLAMESQRAVTGSASSS